MIGLAAMVLSIAEFMTGQADYFVIYLFFAVDFLACAKVFIGRHNWMSAVACTVFATAVLLGVLWPAQYARITAIAFLSAGAIFIMRGIFALLVLSGFFPWFRLSMNRNLFAPTGGYSEIVVGTAGALVFAATSFFLGLNVLEPGRDSVEFNVVKASLSSMCLVFAVYALNHGLLDRGLSMLFIALSVCMSAAVNLAGFTWPMVLDLLFSLGYLALIAVQLLRHQWLSLLAAVFLFLSLSLKSFTAYAAYIPILIAIVSMVTTYLALWNFLRYECIRDPQEVAV